MQTKIWLSCRVKWNTYTQYQEDYKAYIKACMEQTANYKVIQMHQKLVTNKTIKVYPERTEEKPYVRIWMYILQNEYYSGETIWLLCNT